MNKRINRSVYSQLAPTIIWTRHYNRGVDFSLVLLSYIVGKVYRDCHFDKNTNISFDELAAIQSSIRSEKYSLSPLVIQYLDRGRNLRDILLENLMDYPDVKEESSYSDTMRYRVVTPKRVEDALVLKSLSITIMSLLYSKTPMKRDYMDLDVVDLIPSFYDSLLQMGKTSRIYKVNLNPSIETIPSSVVEKQIAFLLGDYAVSKLLFSFVRLPIYNESGEEISIAGIPSVGQLSKALYHITLMGTLDREFPIRFPEFGYTRLLCEAYMFARKEGINEKAVLKLLSELSLIGMIDSIGPGYNAFRCYKHKQIYLESEGTVKLCDEGLYKGKSCYIDIEYNPYIDIDLESNPIELHC